MITMLDSVAAAVWRASWQAAALAVVVAVLVRYCGERLAPRWRYLLWSVVVLRLLFVATPSSPWSAFNFVGWYAQPHMRQVDTHQVDRQNPREAHEVASIAGDAASRHGTESDLRGIIGPEPE